MFGFLHRFFDSLERLKGRRTYSQKPTKNLTHYEVHVTRGYRFKIHCQELVTSTIYHFHFLPTITSMTYRVYCEFSSDVPLGQQQILKREVVFSCLTPAFCSDEFKRKAAIKAYLDLMLAHPKEI